MVERQIEHWTGNSRLLWNVVNLLAGVIKEYTLQGTISELILITNLELEGKSISESFFWHVVDPDICPTCESLFYYRLTGSICHAGEWKQAKCHVITLWDASKIKANQCRENETIPRDNRRNLPHFTVAHQTKFYTDLDIRALAFSTLFQSLEFITASVQYPF